MKKKNFNQLIVMGLVATSLLASCNKNKDAEGTVPENGFRASTEQGGGDSKTHLDGADVKWDAADLILIRSQENGGRTLTYELTEGEGTQNGTFYTGEEHENFFQPDYTAIYPAYNSDEVANSITGDGAATFTLPATQTYVQNSFAKGAMPMMAVSDDQSLAFKNVLGGICFPLTGDDLTVTKIVLTSSSDTDYLSGVFSANYNNGQPTLTCTSGSGNSITLECDPAVTLDATTATDFIVMVPPGSLANGFTVTAYNGENKLYEQSTNSAPGTDFITRSKIMKVNANLQVVVTQLNVTTISPTFITKNTAKGLGMVDNTPVSCGILYAKATDLSTPADDLVVGGTNVTNLSATAGTRFDADLSGLAEDEVYYVRAYAVNEAGTVSYGDPVPFATRYDYYGSNSGKSRHAFSVASGTSVRFSMGNLQYQGSTSTWRFADNQFDYVGDASNGLVYEGGTKCNNGSIAQNYAGWIDLFGWGTSGISGYSPIATCWQPWSTSTDYTQYNPYGSTGTNLNSESGKADWGYNAISNGGNTVNSGWRTLQGGTNGGNTEEWNYLLTGRATTNGYRYAEAQLTVNGTSSQSVSEVNGVSACGATVNGMIVFPDNFAWPEGYGFNAFSTYNSATVYTNNKLTESQWSLLEQAGAVFLPAAGRRNGTSVYVAGFLGYYWSSTYFSSYNAYVPDFGSGLVNPQYYLSRSSGFSVRLVCPAE